MCKERLLLLLYTNAKTTNKASNAISSTNATQIVKLMKPYHTMGYEDKKPNHKHF
jgi:hypothetical protein